MGERETDLSLSSISRFMVPVLTNRKAKFFCYVNKYSLLAYTCHALCSPSGIEYRVT